MATEVDEETRELLSLTEIRRDVYTFLSKMFWKELTPDEVKTLPQRVQALQVLPTVLDSDDQEMVQALDLLAKTTRSFKERKDEKVARELATEYAGLFLGVRQKPSHPSESVYRSSTHLLMQKERDEVLFAYEKAGFEKDENFKEPEDHIALELAFMAALSGAAAECLKKQDAAGFEKSLNKQKRFVDDHLSLWVGDLAHDVDQSARIDFYLAIADLTARFVQLDKQLIMDSMSQS